MSLGNKQAEPVLEVCRLIRLQQVQASSSGQPNRMRRRITDVSWTRSFIAFFLAFQISAVPARCSDTGDPWASVHMLPRRTNFLFLERDLTCHFGQITAVTDQSVVVHTNKLDVTVMRSHLLRVQRGEQISQPNSPYGALALVYSGRSSWADIMAFMPLLSKYPSFQIPMSVATASGKLQKGNLKEVTETEIVLRDSFGKETRVARTEVSRVSYVRSKPLNDNQEFEWDELAMLRIFDPVLYPRLFHVGDTMSVRLYDRTVPEDDSPVQCR